MHASIRKCINQYKHTNVLCLYTYIHTYGRVAGLTHLLYSCFQRSALLRVGIDRRQCGGELARQLGRAHLSILPPLLRRAQLLSHAAQLHLRLRAHVVGIPRRPSFSSPLPLCGTSTSGGIFLLSSLRLVLGCAGAGAALDLMLLPCRRHLCPPLLLQCPLCMERGRVRGLSIRGVIYRYTVCYSPTDTQDR